MQTAMLKSDSGFLIEADAASPALLRFGFDTEGTGRQNIQYLRAPVNLGLFRSSRLIPSAKTEISVDSSGAKYSLQYDGGGKLDWVVTLFGDSAVMSFTPSPELIKDSAILEFPIDPTVAVASVIASGWNEAGEFVLPAVFSIPDIGQLYITCPETPGLTGTIDGNRQDKWINVRFNIPLNHQVTLNFKLWQIPQPEGMADNERWKAARRGWFNHIQISCGASGGGKAVNGVWSNNTLSDPVSSVIYMLSDAAVLIPELAPGVMATDVLRFSVEYWMYKKVSPAGLVGYTAGGTPWDETNKNDCDVGKRQNLMDPNPAVLIAAFNYVRATGDLVWLGKHIERLEFLSSYTESRDIDGDGLVESCQSGNRGSRTSRNPDTAWDCYMSGHKNAYVNALAYRAWHGLSELEELLHRTDKAEKYKKLAERIKIVFQQTFYNPKTGWLGLWKSEDGELHDIYTDIPTSMAIAYGIIEPEAGCKMLGNFGEELRRTGFNRYDLGIPLNTRPVPRDEMEHYTEFEMFLNGGCGVSNTAYYINALYTVDMVQEGDRILDMMLTRQKSGVFANGGGFQNGFVDKMGYGAEVYDWKGNTTGYEGHLVYVWNFLHSLFLRYPEFRKKVFPKGFEIKENIKNE